ncbi:hypothetical protein BDF19DRAFT_454781 [Syncephalis fuscata]|nr:hypothetical protein BDF19DRAFT_454781 [Syncephalis fuscata]
MSLDLVLLPKFTKAVLNSLAASTPGVNGIIDWDARLSGETFISDSMSCVSTPRSVASAESQPIFNRGRRMSSPSVLTYPSTTTTTTASNNSQSVSPLTKSLTLRRNASQLRSLRNNRRCHSTFTTVLPPSPTQLPTSYEENENDSEDSEVSTSDYASTVPTSGTERTLASFDDSSAQSDASSSVPSRRWVSRSKSVSVSSLQSNLEVELSRQISEQKKLREQLASLQNQLQAERAVTRRKMYQDFQEPAAAPVPAPAQAPVAPRQRKPSHASVVSFSTSYSNDTLVNERMVSRNSITSRSAAASSASPPLSPRNNSIQASRGSMFVNGTVYTEVNLPAIPAQRILVRRGSQAQLPAGSPPRSVGMVQSAAPARPMYQRKMSLPLMIDTNNCSPNGYRVKLSPRQSVRVAGPPSPNAEEQMPNLVPIKQSQANNMNASVEHSIPAFNAYRMRKVVRRSPVSSGAASPIASPRSSDDERDMRRFVCQPRTIVVRRDEQAQYMPAGFSSVRRRHSVASHAPSMVSVKPAMGRKMSMAQLPSNAMYMMRPTSYDTSCDESSDLDTSSPLTTPSLSQDSDDSFGYQMRPPQPSIQRQIERSMSAVLASHRQNVASYARSQEEPSTSVQLTSRGAQSRVRSDAKAVKASSSKGKARGVWSRPSVSVASSLAPSTTPSPSLPCTESLWNSTIRPATERYSRPSASKVLRNSSSFDALYATRAEAPWLFVPSAIDEVDDSVSEISSISSVSSPVYDGTARMYFASGSPNSRQATPL